MTRAWRADLVPKSIQNRAVVAEKNRRKSAHFDTERAHNVQSKHKNNALMSSAPCRATLVILRRLGKPCGCVAFEISAEFRRNPRDFRRKIARVFGANRTARSQKASETMHAVCMKLQSFMRMSCDRHACLARRSCAKIDAKPRGCRPKKSKKICALRHGTRAQRAKQAQKQIIDVLCAVQIHAGALHGLGKPCAQRWVRKRCRISPRSARFSPEFKSCAFSPNFSARIAPHDHRKCQKPCMQSA